MIDLYAIECENAIAAHGTNIAKRVGAKIKKAVDTGIYKRLRDGALMTPNRLENMFDEELFFMKADQNSWVNASPYHKFMNVEHHIDFDYDRMDIKV